METSRTGGRARVSRKDRRHRQVLKVDGRPALNAERERAVEILTDWDGFDTARACKGALLVR